MISIAATNAHAVPVPGGSPVYSTNPLAFGFPLGDAMPPVIIDQSSSATAYVNIVAAATAGRPIPEGWAVDGEGEPTSDANEALAGALLPFGGRKGANVALMVEMLGRPVWGIVVVGRGQFHVRDALSRSRTDIDRDLAWRRSRSPCRSGARPGWTPSAAWRLRSRERQAAAVGRAGETLSRRVRNDREDRQRDVTFSSL